MSDRKIDLGDIEGAIRGHYDRRDAGVEGFGAVIPVVPAVSAAPEAEAQNGQSPSFIHLDYTINENGHRDFQLTSQGVADDIKGIIAELQHTLSHLINDSQAAAE